MSSWFKMDCNSPYKSTFLVTSFTNVYHVSLNLAIYERVRDAWASARLGAYKGPYYYAVAKILAQ